MLLFWMVIFFTNVGLRKLAYENMINNAVYYYQVYYLFEKYIFLIAENVGVTMWALDVPKTRNSEVLLKSLYKK